MKTFKWLVFALVLVGATVFAVGNRQTALISLDPMPYTLEMPVYLVVFVSGALGVLLASFVIGWSSARRIRRLRQLDRDNARLRAEIERQRAAAALPAQAAKSAPPTRMLALDE
ncbi:MAG: LapA family protein [Alphaproteobacteria bacterium]|nr:LapA family protein [Alphaproteobacteria bacterium]